MSSKTSYIIEVANTHGGSLSYLLDLIKEFEEFEGSSIKFQPLHPDKIATDDYQWYPVYKELYFSPSEWNTIVEEASLTKLVWLDLFDTYGVEILNNNLGKIHGIKLQASILYNAEVIKALEEMDCSSLDLIINVSAIQKGAIAERLETLKKSIGPKQILLEVGFQSYPTQLEDSGLNKIKELREQFDNPIVFADHLAGDSEDAIIFPLVASLFGADYLEKHVMHSNLETKYDYFSSIKVADFKKLVEKVEAYGDLPSKPFINQKEIDYLVNSIQKPLAKTPLEAGKGINIQEDLLFRRSAQNGLSVSEISKLKEEHYILATDLNENQTLRREHFKKASIGTIIAGRLKSSRLKRKALLPIGQISSIEKCIQSCLKFPESSNTILATSTEEEDAELASFTYASNVLFHQGHPDDVIQRYLDITRKHKLDVIYRVTADMPYVSSEIAELLLKSHFETGADYTAARVASVGTAPEIINVQALEEVKSHFPNADYSEYMTWYFQNNKEHFRVNIVDLPEELIRDYRLTLDYKEDLDLFQAVDEHLSSKGKEENIKEIFTFLDSNPNIAQLNSHIGLKYKTDQALIDTLNRVTKIN